MTRILFASLLTFTICTPALCQTAVPPAGNIDDRVRQQVRPTTERDRQEALMTGDTDIILLRRTKLFSVTGSLDVTHTSNAFLSPLDISSDDFAQGQIGIGIGTRIGGKVDVFASGSVVGVRYFNEKALDYSAALGAVGARVSFGQLAVAATYQPSVVFNRDFSKRQLTSHRFRLGAAMGLRVRGINIEPEVHGERSITRPTDFSAWSGGGSMTLSAPLSKTVPIFAYAQAGYDRRSFDDYFTAFVGTKRLDDNLSASVGVVWRPRSWGEVRVSYSYGRNWSTSDVNRYSAHSGTLGINATARF